MEIIKHKTHPGNVIRYCPRCGSESFLFDGEKAFKCQTCRFHFFINSACAVAVIILNAEGDMLFTRRAVDPHKGMLDLPGGFVDPLESAEESVIREIKEELNLDVVSMQYMASFPNDYVFSNYSVFTTDLCFLCEVKSFEHMHAKDDISGYEFIHPGDIDFNQIGSESIKNIVRAYIRTISSDLD
ncbi:NUDIX domain-containing protein [Carboxylicivirga sediminis]|uniref:NUDIX domain-containing protein n=1 Tax=Carboxylicivirga sediminis TaxID=2006564 RepID=A0A941F0Z9_9BACT|nr:NUDIX domain-containing protein [Carboxylicivirga sediminis]MBR8534263.1 NUDIX domain-containing protein [Carboxylicivirga sediminis]